MSDKTSQRERSGSGDRLMPPSKKSNRGVCDREGTGVADALDIADATSDEDKHTEILLNAISGRSVALCGVKNTIHVLIEIVTPEAPRATSDDRQSLQAVCVLDKSGSMHGSKIKFAKRAVRKLIKHLSSKDKLALVAFDSDVETVFSDGDISSEEGKENLVAQVKAITPGSMTNLHGGLMRGASCLRGDADEEENTVKRVFLFSDGLVNEGETNRNVILSAVDDMVQKDSISVSTFGIGRDFDEDLMTRVASRGRGDYNFLKTAESIPKLVSKSIHRFLALAGTDASVSVFGKNGAVVRRVYGINEDDEDGEPDAKGMNNTIFIGDLHLGNTKHILVEVEVAPASSTMGTAPQATKVLDYELTYNKQTRGAETSTTSAGHCVLKGNLSISFVTDQNEVPALEADEVAVALAIQNSVDGDNRVLALVGAGRRQDAIAHKEMSIGTLDDLLGRLQPDSPSATRLLRVRERAAKTLQGLKDCRSDAQEMCMEIRFEQQVQENMSDCGYHSGYDSDTWSEGDVNEDLSLDGLAQMLGRAHSPPYSPNSLPYSPNSPSYSPSSPCYSPYPSDSESDCNPQGEN